MKEPPPIEAVWRYPPSAFPEEIIALKKRHTEQVWRDYGFYVKLFEHYFERMARMIDDLNRQSKTGWPQHRGVQYAFFPGALKTLYRGFESWLGGFYDEASIMNRTVLDAILRVIFVSCYPTNFEAVLIPKVRKGRVAFNATNFMRDEIFVDWEWLWSLNSGIVHAKHRALDRLMSETRHEQRVVPMELTYDHDAVTGPMNDSTFLAFALLRLQLRFFSSNLAKTQPDALEKIADIGSALRNFLLHMENRLKNTVRDVERVERIIEAAENGEDWRAVARKDRPPEYTRD